MLFIGRKQDTQGKNGANEKNGTQERKSRTRGMCKHVMYNNRVQILMIINNLRRCWGGGVWIFY